jgi:hypothetical protein
VLSHLSAAAHVCYFVVDENGLQWTAVRKSLATNLDVGVTHIVSGIIKASACLMQQLWYLHRRPGNGITGEHGGPRVRGFVEKQDSQPHG